jgi:hypothetical protein
MNFTTNVSFPREIIEGDQFDFTATVDADLTSYKARCKFFDAADNEIDLNTENDGGADSEILITPGELSSTIFVTVAKSLTDDFEKQLHIELQLENSSGSIVRTIFRKTVSLIQSKLSED